MEKRTVSGKLAIKLPSIKKSNTAREIRAGAVDDAIPKLTKQVADEPDNVDAWRNLARAYNEKRDFKNGLKAVEQLERLQPETQSVQILKAMTLSNMKDFDKSLPILENLYRQEPETLVVLDCLKVGHYNKGRVQEARKFGGEALKLRDKKAGEFAAKSKFEPIEHTFWKQEERTRKVISYSLYGEKQLYHHGAVVNVRLAKYIFPEWSCRVYVGDEVPRGVVGELQRSGAEVIFASREHADVPRAFWRFLVADDPTVKFFIIRDCDARPTVKDAVAVEAWLDRGRPFHVFRDHVLHNMPIMGGMWGGRTDYTWNMASRIANYCQSGMYNLYGADQDFLMNHIWPLIRDKAMVYDSHYNLAGSSNFPYFGKGDDKSHLGMGIIGNGRLRAEAMDFGLPRPGSKKIAGTVKKPS